MLLQQEKALTRMKDAVSAARRRMPMVEVRSDYAFDGPQGRVDLLDLFEGRPQLIVQHFMFAPDWDEGCDGCSMMAEHIGPLSHLHARRTSFVLTSRAPLATLQSFRTRMGWQLPGYSTMRDSFNEDFGATVDGEDLTPFGRQESWENSPPGWPQEPTYSWMRLSDRYGDMPSAARRNHTSD